jgi:hypothetical protein
VGGLPGLGGVRGGAAHAGVSLVWFCWCDWCAVIVGCGVVSWMCLTIACAVLFLSRLNEYDVRGDYEYVVGFRSVA